jgi:hypothetical protein
MVLLGGALSPVFAYKVKDPKANLDNRVFFRPELRVTDTVELSDNIRGLLPNAKELDGFVADNGTNWYFFVDQRTGRVNLLDGGAIPFIPGPMNSLRWEDYAAGCQENRCIPVDRVEKLARDFLSRYQGVFRLNPDEFVLDPNGSGPVWSQYYFLRFQWAPAGIPVEGGSIFFRINNGNLIQVATEKISDFKLDPIPNINLNTAWEIMKGYLGEDAPNEKDEIVEPGRVLIIPITPVGDNADLFNGRFGQMIDYKLVYSMSFRRPDVQGTWEGIVDAHTGELLRFVDTDRYGHVQGGIRPSDGLPPEEFRPFPLADTGQTSPNNYTDSAGNFTGNNATVTLTGKHAHIADTCGTISAVTTAGDINFGSGPTGTDCSAPAGNTYGAGNTKPSRTLFYNCTAINLKAQIYAPSNTWLTNPANAVTLHVNGTAECNARSGGADIYFYKQIAGTCNNLGEIPGVAMHEWAHSYDTNDGSGGQTPPLETYADWTAIIQTHNSCTGAGFLIGANCSRYGNPCLDCTGVRDCDYMKHAIPTGYTEHVPWTSANHADAASPSPPATIWACTSGSYNGPCGWEDHCESGISTQALWDFVYRDLTDACPDGPMCNSGFSPLDIATAWMLEDRLWFAGVLTNTASYTCSGGVSNGCSGTVLYSVMRALDDDGDGTANGTPHAHAIYHAMQRHLMHCNTWNDTSAQNQNQTSCPTLTTPTLTGVAGSNQVTLNWTTGGASATRYFVYKNESGCDVAFNRIAIVTAPTLTYTDNACVNGVTYYYRVQAVTANDSCVSPSSNCHSVTPQPCAGSISLDKTLYNCSDTVNVSVLDSTPGTSPWTVTAWSTTDATVKTITLTNNPVGSAIYTGSFTTTTGTAGSTQVRVADGATITIRYTDKDYCGTPNTNVDKTVLVDCAGPTISSVTVTGLTDSSAVVTWTTNEAANSRVTYGLATPPGTNKDDLAVYGTSHSVTVTGLTGCTKYYFSVTSADAAGNSTTDTNAGTYYNFTTYGRAFAMGPDDVEGGVLSWVVSPTTGTNIWHQDLCKAVSGTHSWKAGKSDSPTCTAQYDISLANYFLTWNANINLGAAGHGYHLRFNEWYDTESNTGCTYDPLRTQISTDGGAAWTTLATNCGASGGWLARDYDLAAYTGSTVRIRFYFTSDSSQNGLGWFVDDINISKSQSCTAEVSYQSNTFTDACSGTGTGVGNGYVDPGEDITVHPTLKNTGSQGATGISATLSTSTSNITVTGATATYPDLAVGASGACNTPHFTYSVGTGVACGTTINFTLTITAAAGGGPWTQNFTATVGNSVAGGAITDFSENFSSVTTPNMPTGWTRSNTSGNPWRTATTACTTIGLQYPYNTSTAANSWAYTPGIALVAGTTYTLNFNQKVQSASFPEIFEVKCGTAATPAGQTITVLASATYTNTTCTARTPTFTVPSSGTYFIGFHCTSGADEYYLWIDDIALTHTSTPSCTVQACTPGSAPPGEAAPGNTPATSQGWTSKTAHNWPSTSGATSYKVYRGIQGQLANLLNSGTDSCVKYDGASTNCAVNDDPAGEAGRFYWYLVTASNTGGEGTAGTHTNGAGGPRVLNSTGNCP